MCIHTVGAYIRAKEFQKNRLIEKQNAVKTEITRVDNCAGFIDCVKSNSEIAYNYLNNGFISNGKPFCEGGIFDTQYGGLSGQISNLEDLNSAYETYKKDLEAIKKAYQDDIEQLQHDIDNPPDLGDCEICAPPPEPEYSYTSDHYAES